jgi:hypothetical protein
MAELRCNKGDCTVKFCPLTLSYGRTLHTFQGQSAGPTPPDKPDNEVQVIICDPGNRGFEGINPGCFYSMLSRATTLGDEQGRNSALYWDGPNMSPNRCMNLTLDSKGNIYKKVQLRNEWVKLLKSRPRLPAMTEDEKQKMIEWATNTKISIRQLDECLESYTWRNPKKFDT